jgi:hypothetical protein
MRDRPAAETSDRQHKMITSHRYLFPKASGIGYNATMHSINIDTTHANATLISILFLKNLADHVQVSQKHVEMLTRQTMYV